MKTVKIAELKDRLSEHLREVERGAEVIVTHRNRKVARIVPIVQESPSVVLQPPKLPFAPLRARRRSPARWPVASLDLLPEERREA